MINNFEKQTAKLTAYEKVKVLPVVCEWLKNHQGKEQVISNKQMRKALNEQGYFVSGVAMRKIISHIRLNGLVSCLLANGDGYYVSTDQYEVKHYIESLRQRADSICAVADALEEDLKSLPQS